MTTPPQPATWACIDPDTGNLLRHRPAWDAAVWLLSLAGLVVCASGVVIGWRRLFRGRRRRA
ncbi:hypothetical protein RA280_29175 [Cupriavidus sp. CV2]|uniref:hypothetical protein n=1 Tax=Cupriavidus ulmosensis TaxID=3065913 RepID=UPI00296AD317|nr:hypothetical protein [Cupriavidus sp. CV2]MDW3685738.1 hypothetical protein [Cupriavidus sp. CV2]